MHHPGQSLDHYSMGGRSFFCEDCIHELKGTPKEVELNVLQVQDVGTMYQAQIELQQILDLDQDVNIILT